jgi:ATP phosphoribosyltransferase
VEILTVAIPSGRLFEPSLRRLEAAGLARPAVPEDRSLLLSWPELGTRVLVAKPVDLVTYVERGAADCGIVGKDILLEQNHEVYELLDLGFGRCRGVVAFPPEVLPEWVRPTRILRIATKYPRIAQRFFWERNRAVDIIHLWGSVELAPRVGLSDGILDLVMTGRTLRANGLVEAEEVFTSTARLVVNRVALRAKADRIQELLDRLRGSKGVFVERP